MHSRVLGLLLLATTSAALNKAPFLDNSPKIVPGSFIYEFHDNADPSSFYQVLEDKAEIRMKYTSDLFKGVSVKFSGDSNYGKASIQAAQSPIVKKIWPVYYFEQPKIDFTPVHKLFPDGRGADKRQANDTFGPHIMMQVDKLRDRGVTGRGIKVAVIDSGVDYKHPALGGCFGKGCLVSFGYDIVGDEYNGGNGPKPDPDPMDCGSHGTHVSGIIAAQPNELGFTGVAPGVSLGAYKVFGCSGGVGTDVLVSAVTRAVDDGAQIITASIGAAGGFSVDLWSNLLSRVAHEKDIPCTVAAGNEGSYGAFYPSGTASGADVMSIAAFDNIETTSILSAANFTTSDEEPKSFGYAPGDPKKWDNVTLPIWALNLDPTVADDGCSPFPENTPNLSEYIVLLRRGTCTFVQKAQNAAAKGAKYLMLYNNVPGTLSIGVTDVKQIIASGMVSPKVGEAWLKDLAAGQTVTLHMFDLSKAKKAIEVLKNTATGGAVSGFSSWGPTMEMNFKPQFGAPGGNILSTLPRSFGGYGVASGTSMSTPMTAAVIALLGEARGTLNVALIRNLLSANANPQLYNQADKFFEFLAPVAQQAGGLIQAYDAAYATTLLEPASLTFNDTENLKRELSFTIRNTGKDAITYHIAQRPAASVYVLAKDSIYPSQKPNEVVAAYASLKLSDEQATIKPGGSQVIKVNPVPPSGVDEKRLALWSGYVTVNGSDGSSMSIPYEGLAGSLRKSTTLAADGAWVANSTDKTQAPVPANSVFNLRKPGTGKVEDGIPLIVAKLALGSSNVTMDLVSGTRLPQTKVGELDGSPFIWVTRGQIGQYFDGKLKNGTYALAGDYKIVTKALRIAGNPSEAKDWDVSESVQFSIKYDG
ncbi:hypothetical protein QQS21_001940 [Conoideocrella luteorostrata]|uniref:Uncharacterized protein n=1 Tax=Conoideocrella luteorostrata TaxID=1105319 RepID=A0AAJ0CYU0_9HYPO|nr:hypothetical protein QQS21_001940 [Conoideocrella luteorostrata]